MKFELSFLAGVLLLLGCFGSFEPPVKSEIVSLALLPVAHTVSSFTDQELKCISQVVWAEARGEPLEGQLAVALVVINRSLSGRYPSDVFKVARQPKQFSKAKGGSVTSVFIAELATRQYGLVPEYARHWLFFQRGKHKGATKIGQHSFYA